MVESILMQQHCFLSIEIKINKTVKFLLCYTSSATKKIEEMETLSRLEIVQKPVGGSQQLPDHIPFLKIQTFWMKKILVTVLQTTTIMPWRNQIHWLKIVCLAWHTGWLLA